MAFAQSSAFDAVIVGAGIVGTACAAELTRAGLTVGVVESDTVGSGATSAGMGHIVVLDDSAAQCELTRYSQKLWDALVCQMPEAHEYSRCGTLWIAGDEAEMAEVERKHQVLRSHDVQSVVLGRSALPELEPNLRPGLAGALLVPGDSIVYAPRSASILWEDAKRHGARMLRGVAAGLVQAGVRLADGRIVQGQTIIVANGFGAADLLPELQLRAKKGHLAITDRYPGFVKHQLAEVGYGASAHATSGDSVAFNVQPRGTGQLLVGSSRQFDAREPAVDHRVLSMMLRRAESFLPGLGACTCLRVWTGLRAATADGLPFIGPHPTRPGVWVATGHEGLGVTTAPATAALLTAQLLGRPPEIPIAPYLPERCLKGVDDA